MSENEEQLITCPDCDASYDASGFEPGKKFECQLCGAIVKIPESLGEDKKPEVASEKGSKSGRPKVKSKSRSGRSRTSSRSTRSRSGRGRGTRSGGREDGSRGEEEEGFRGRKSDSNKTAKLIFAFVAGIGALIGIFVLASSTGSGGDEASGEEKTAKTNKKSNQNTASDSGVGSASVDDSSSSSSSPSESSGSDASSADDTGGTSGKDVEADTEGGWGGSDKEEEEAEKEESDQGASSSGGTKWRNKPREWEVPTTVKQAFLNRFSNVSNMSTKKLKMERKKFKEDYELNKVIPALISVYGDANERIAAQANKLLKEITQYSGAPKVTKGLSRKQRQENFQTWKDFWLHLNWEGYKKKLKKEAKFAERMEEVKPLCKDVATQGYAGKQKARRKIKKRGKEVIPVLIALMKDKHMPAVSKGARTCLHEFTGQQFAEEMPRKPKARYKYVKKWEDWWDKNKDSFSFE